MDTLTNFFVAVKFTLFTSSPRNMILTVIFSEATLGGSSLLLFFIYDCFSFLVKNLVRCPCLTRPSISFWRTLHLTVLCPWSLWNSHRNFWLRFLGSVLISLGHITFFPYLWVSPPIQRCWSWSYSQLVLASGDNSWFFVLLILLARCGTTLFLLLGPLYLWFILCLQLFSWRKSPK